MKFLLVLGWGLMATVAAMPAPAAPFDSGADFRSFMQNQPSRPEPQREAERPAPQRDTRAPGEEADRARMSPEERRQLRRDIQDAGRDIYRPARQGRGDPRGSGRR